MAVFRVGDAQPRKLGFSDGRHGRRSTRFNVGTQQALKKYQIIT